MPIERIGQEFLVNTTTVDGQYSPSITALADGRFLVTWYSDDATGSDTSDTCIRARLYNADGSAAGSDFVVNSTATGAQYAASATALADGRFVVTWESWDASDGNVSCIRARFYNADGSAAGDDFVVNSTTAGYQFVPSVTALPDGGFVVAWDSNHFSNNTLNDTIRARLYTAAGVPAGNDFVVCATANNLSPSVTALPDGRFLVTWESNDASGGDTSGFGIRARLHNADGSAAGDEFAVNSTTVGGQQTPSAMALPDGRFLVTWSSDDGSGSDTSDGCIRARLYNANGSAAGNDFVVNSTTADEQYAPSITALADGRFVVAWQSYDEDAASGSDTSGYSIRARLFNVDGSFAGDDFIVNTTARSSQIFPSIAALADGRFVATWESYDGIGGDRSASAIRAQVFDSTVFNGTAGEDIWQGGNLADEITGYDGADTLSGLGGDDTLKGGGGGDTLDGGAGNDWIDGGAGDDRIDGGSGDDAAGFFGAFASYTIQDLGDRITVTGPDGTDTLTSIEELHFTDIALRVGTLALAAIAEDSGARVITQAELLSGVGAPQAVARDLAIASGPGTLTDNHDGTWTYRPAANDGSAVSFSYSIDEGNTNDVTARASLDITPVDDAPVVSGAVTLDAIAEDSGARLITQAELLANASDVDGPSLQAVNLQIASGRGTLTDNHDGSWTYRPAANDDTAVSFSYSIGDGNVVTAHASLDITPVNDAPAVRGAVTLAPIDEDSGARLITQGELLANASDVDGPSLTAVNLQISAGLGALADNGNGTWSYTPAANDDSSVSFSYSVTDGAAPVATSAKLFINPVSDAPPSEPGTPGDDRFDGGLGIDTMTFGFRLVDATVSHDGNKVIIDGPSGQTTLTGFERFVFTDGTVDNADGDRLVDDLFYYAGNHDVWNAGADADAHYHQFGWHEGRDPNALFSTATYLSLHPDAQAANFDPLLHFDQFGDREGRASSIAFDPAAYLAANPDVRAAGVDPLRHYLESGYQEGRAPVPFDHLLAPNGFDYVWYLQHNPDVAAAQVDPLQHFQTTGWKEGRNPNALFDTAGYLATYADVAAAGINPLEHYNAFGWREGRDPSTSFDTLAYLAAHPDVAAADINPLQHFLQFGIDEGRSPFADGIWG